MRYFNRLFLIGITIVLFFAGTVNARKLTGLSDDVLLGAQLYDKWYVFPGVNQPEGNMPIWERQKTNSRSGPETWRCSECHGWDYSGSEGMYKSGSHFTGFPNVKKLSESISIDEIVLHLKGSKDPSHNFSKYLSDTELQKLAIFLHDGLKDDSFFIDRISLKSTSGNLEHGKKLYDMNCAKCHGLDGKLIIFRSEGINEFLGSVAQRDPYRFLHRTRYGVAGVKSMPAGMKLGFTDSDSGDLLAYSQSLPNGNELIESANAGIHSVPSPVLGGPQGGVLGGFVTGITAFFGMIGISSIFLIVLIFIGVMIVWLLKKRN